MQPALHEALLLYVVPPPVEELVAVHVPLAAWHAYCCAGCGFSGPWALLVMLFFWPHNEPCPVLSTHSLVAESYMIQRQTWAGGGDADACTPHASQHNPKLLTSGTVLISLPQNLTPTMCPWPV
eukprot:COSAG01_NODE_2950_length_6804_cov_89.553318_7_plen_124_part_00